ncbi:hypothetical protein BaRGS_00005585 [Batillaria attramentaria]|uniref:Major facilitator superfamily (MFS) profile domain-containing protein n=1 Tax=Batillaria attramentaria TaxID=370345 RepID=A0ABD0LUT2_9CAEN
MASSAAFVSCAFVACVYAALVVSGDDTAVNKRSPANTKIRLVDGSRDSEGRVEVFLKGEWGTVCDDGFSDEEAEVACRMLGYTGGVPTAKSRAHYGEGRGRILLDDVSCRGTETDLMDCDHNDIGDENCDHDEDVGVDCQPRDQSKLLFASFPLFEITDVRVRMNHAIFEAPSGDPVARDDAFYGEGSGPILLDNVDCNGRESNIMDCDHNDVGDHNCDHDEDVGVDCRPSTDVLFGALKPTQLRLFLLLSLPIVMRGFQNMMTVVIFSAPDHRCKIPGLDNDTYAIQNEAHEVLVSETIPVDKDGAYDDCQMYTDSEGTFGNGTYACHAWVYDRSDFVSTVITQFDLVCDKREFRAHFNMAYMLGFLVGSSTTGFLCDKFGRKPVFFISVILSMVVGTVSAYPGMIEILITFRFLLGVFGTGVYLALYVLTMEFVGPSKRTLAGSLMMVIWLVGPYLVGAISFGVRDWRYIQLLSSLPLIFSIGFWWLIPESPRWMLSKGKVAETLKVITKAAEVNKKTLPPDLDLSPEKEEESVLKDSRQGPLQYLKHPNLVIRSLIICFNWAVVAMTYYGLSLNVDNLVGNVRVNFMLSNTVELVGYVIAWVLLDRVGRKRLHFGLMLVCGVALLATIFVVTYGSADLQWLTTALAMVGKLCVSGAFSVIYLITAELYPTVLRNFGMGCSSTVARVGSAVSPYIADLGVYVGGQFGKALPLIIFGAFAVTAGGLSLILPETLNRKLPDTIEDAASFGG